MYSPDILPQSYSLWSSSSTKTSSSSSSSPSPPPPALPSQERLQDLLWLHRNSHTLSSNLLLKLQLKIFTYENPIQIRFINTILIKKIYHKWSKRKQYLLSHQKVLNLKSNSSKILVDIPQNKEQKLVTNKKKFLKIFYRIRPSK